MNRSASNKTERRILNLLTSDVTLLKELGRGNYGKVFLAHINDRQLGIGINCAAKVINEPCDKSSNNLPDDDDGASNELHALKNELSIYERLHPNHPSFPKLIGIVRDDDNFMLITEYVEGGDLLKFLRSKARGKLFIEQTLNNFDNNIQAQKDTQSAPVGSITSSTLVYIALQIANALKYLINDLNILHRDIAARNILITGDFVIKIADFGLARVGYYEQPSRMALPFLNLALETLQTCKFTPKSEVWQFGVLLYEIFSLGKQPYCDLFTKYAVVKPVDKLVEFLEGGGRLLPPKGMPESIQRLMAKCFLENPEERPTFNSITETLYHLLQLVSPELALIVDASSHLDDEPSNPHKFIKHSYKGGYLQPRSNMLPLGRKKTRSLPPLTMTDNISSETEQACSPELEEKAVGECQEHFKECSEWVKDVVKEGWEHESEILNASVNIFFEYGVEQESV
uniref:Protein kinase domain-containing protein n=1 Tax=Plectus sambesii TaxID=2011161 RepID=A0A914VBZ9_9BILA